MDNPKRTRIVGQQLVEILLQRPAVRTAKLAEICDRNYTNMLFIAKKRRAGVCAQSIGPCPSSVWVICRQIEANKCSADAGRLALDGQTSKRRKVCNLDVIGTFPGQAIPWYRPDAIDRCGDAPDYKHIAAPDSHSTTTGVPTGTWS